MESSTLPQFTESDSGLPFSKCVQIGRMLYLSGEIGVRADGSLSAGFEEQARQTMDNIITTLASQGLPVRSIVKCTIMLADMSDWERFNAIYLSYFGHGHLPIRSAFGTNGLAKGALLEVECIACFDFNS